MKRHRSIANRERRIFTTQLLKLGSRNRPMRFWEHCKKSNALWEGSGPRPHLNPLPRGEEDAKRKVRVIVRAPLILICCIAAVTAETTQCCNYHIPGCPSENSCCNHCATSRRI